LEADLRFATIVDLRRLLRSGEVTASELVEAAMQRLDLIGREYHMLAELMWDDARRDARTADEMLRAGRSGPLTGIPYGAKDLIDTAGVPTRWGAPPYADRTPSTDAAVVRRLRSAGAILVAKLALIELAGAGGYRSAAASINGACRNPWGSARWTGGSSSGSAAVVASGLLPFSLGSETGGSLIYPAAYCGVSTLRPSYGAVSRTGTMELAWSMDKIGPIAGTVDDCEAVFSVISGEDSSDWTTVEWAYHRNRGRVFRVGIIEPDAGPQTTFRAFQEAINTFRLLGFKLRDVKLPKAPYQEIHNTILGVEAAVSHRELIMSGEVDALLDAEQAAALRRGAATSLSDYANAVRDRSRLGRPLRDILRTVDVLITPTLLIEATRIDEDQLEARKRRGGLGWLGSLWGLPAISVPMGFGPDGLPLGLSVIGDLLQDATIIRVGSLYQRATEWHRQHPLVAS
jgi:Asp-tRNA(Asn)/Glu-tRNA(Gln) amidotransferase A subunit family amidase